MMKKLKGEKGFSLVEVILVMGIITLMLTVLYAVFMNSSSVYDFNTEKISVQQDHRAIIERMAPYIRMAKKITINESYDSSNDKVRFEFTPIIDSPSYNGIGFGIKENGEFYYRKCIETSSGDFEWGNRMTFINSRVSSFELSQDDGKLTISIELLEKGGNKYVFVDEFYPRVPDQGENGGEKE